MSYFRDKDKPHKVAGMRQGVRIVSELREWLSVCLIRNAPFVVFLEEEKSPMDVLQFLKKDHKMVKELFAECANLAEDDTQNKPVLVVQICQALNVDHAV